MGAISPASSERSTGSPGDSDTLGKHEAMKIVRQELSRAQALAALEIICEAHEIPMVIFPNKPEMEQYIEDMIVGARIRHERRAMGLEDLKVRRV